MNFTSEQVTELRSVLTACKSVGIESIVIADSKVMGTTPKFNLAVITPTTLAFGDTKLGISKITELTKRMELFDSGMAIEAKVGQRGDVVQLSISKGRSKAQYRCTAAAMIPHPKENADTPFSLITIPKDEVLALVKAIRVFAPENVIVKISSDGAVHIECSDSTNDVFSTVLSGPAAFVEDSQAVLFTYLAANFTGVLGAAVGDAQDEVLLTLGEAGSISVPVRGRDIIIMPNVSEE